MSLPMGLDVPEKPKIKEIDFRRQVVQLAAILGWEHVGFRAAMTTHGWRTPGTGSMAKGWPDLTLVRERDRRLVFAELKAEKGKLSPDQVRVLDVLRSIADVYVWRPDDLDSIAEILR